MEFQESGVGDHTEGGSGRSRDRRDSADAVHEANEGATGESGVATGSAGISRRGGDGCTVWGSEAVRTATGNYRRPAQGTWDRGDGGRLEVGVPDNLPGKKSGGKVVRDRSAGLDGKATAEVLELQRNEVGVECGCRKIYESVDGAGRRSHQGVGHREGGGGEDLCGGALGESCHRHAGQGAPGVPGSGSVSGSRQSGGDGGVGGGCESVVVVQGDHSVALAGETGRRVHSGRNPASGAGEGAVHAAVGAEDEATAESTVKKLVVLVDGKNLAYRCHFAHKQLSTREGEPTGMLHGFLSELLRLHKVEPKARVVIAWDGQGPTWRHELRKEYKANRPVNPEYEKMKKQSEVLVPLLKRLRFWVPVVDGVEADDVIGILATKLARGNWEVRIYSSDKDMYQLLANQPGITVWKDWQEKPWTREDVEKQMGVPPEELLELRAMAGDPTDNLKGLKGIGPKKAAELLKAGVRPSKQLQQLLPQAQQVVREWGAEWGRVQEEYRMQTIITNPKHEVWTQKQRLELEMLVNEIGKEPGRLVRYSEKMEEAFYLFLGKYELVEVQKERTTFWRMP